MILNQFGSIESFWKDTALCHNTQKGVGVRNIQLLCQKCNRRKGASEPGEV